MLSMAPDLVALQEVTINSAAAVARGAGEAGLAHSVTPLDEARPPKPRRLAMFTAAREPLTPLELGELPWPERAVSVEIGGIEVLNVHSPIAPSPGLAKVLTHEALFAYAREGDRSSSAATSTRPAARTRTATS